MPLVRQFPSLARAAPAGRRLGGRRGGRRARPAVPLYLALGDSLAAGVGASEPAQTGYVGLVFDALRTEPASPYRESGLTLLNLGVSGRDHYLHAGQRRPDGQGPGGDREPQR